jgi:hypothetical protein
VGAIRLTELLPEEYLTESIFSANDSIKNTLYFIKGMASMPGTTKSELDSLKSRFINQYNAYSNKIINETPKDKRAQVVRILQSVVHPFKTATTASELMVVIEKLISNNERAITSINKHNKFKISKLIAHLKASGKSIGEWWDSNKHDIIRILAEILLRIVIEIVFAILRSLLKTSSLKAPKISLRGSGGFGSGGAGASGKW